MKRFLPMSVMFLLGLTVLLVPSVPSPGLSGPSPVPVARGGDRHEENRTFSGHDRRVAYDYALHHQDELGFRHEDRVAPEYESRLRAGYVLDEGFVMCRPAPPDLVGVLGPCPPGYRYVVIGRHVCLIDNEHRIHDTIHLEIGL